MSKWLGALALLLTLGCSSVPAQAPLTPTIEPTVTTVPASPTPDARVLTGAITSPKCLGGYDIVGANVTIRDENNSIVGAAVTEYTGHPGLLAYERDHANPTERGPDVAYEALWDALEDQGPIEKGSRNGGRFIRSDAMWDTLMIRQGERPNPEYLQKYDPRLWFWAKAWASKNEQQEQQVLRDIFRVDDLACHAKFISSVSNARFYQFRIGTHDAPTYSLEELRARDFNVSLTLGQ